MFRTTVLSTAALLGLAVLAPTTASAAGETCQGRPATLVGSPTTFTLTGTEGPDVIVTNGSMQTEALGGDDLICVTGRGGAVRAGDGDDVVDTTQAPTQLPTSAYLGAGSDTFVGGPGRDTVFAGDKPIGTGGSMTDTERDVIDTGPRTSSEFSPDRVETGQPGTANADEITMDRGVLVWEGDPTPASKVDGGSDSYLAVTAAATDDLRIDNRHGTFSRSGSPTLHFSGFTGFNLVAPDAPTAFTFRGSRRDESLDLTFAAPSSHVVRMGGGDDEVSVYAYGTRAAAGSSYLGGQGRDLLELTLPEEVHAGLDLRKGRLAMGRKRHRATITAKSFEDATVMARDVAIHGTGRANRIAVYACRSRVHGRGGNDRISAFDELMDEGLSHCHGVRANFFGDRGKDVLLGSRGRDRLIGGPGRDRADGKRGRDVCSAEKVRRCEVRR